MQEKNQISSLFRARLQSLLSERGVSQRQVALATGLSQQTVNNYLRAVSKLPGAHELLALSRYFGVSMEYFVTTNEKDTPSTSGKDTPSTSGSHSPSTSGSHSVKALPAVPASEVRKAADRMHRYAEELRAEADRLKRLSGGS